MKKVISNLLLGLFVASSSFAVTIEKISYDETTQKISVDIFYGGGSMEHRFELVRGPLAESSPMKMQATLRHLQGADDQAEMMLSDTLHFDVSDLPKPISLSITDEDQESFKMILIER